MVMVVDLGNFEGIFGLDFLVCNYVIFDIGKGVLKFKNFDLVLINEFELENLCVCV